MRMRVVMAMLMVMLLGSTWERNVFLQLSHNQAEYIGHSAGISRSGAIANALNPHERQRLTPAGKARNERRACGRGHFLPEAPSVGRKAFEQLQCCRCRHG